ncbi:NAD-dependent epimerase/dehydratase family protein [Rhodococcus sp. G-MC3]|uniref:NAD-dependent epimerase/dehydratase family protein n=1 Tax=Rhodococcus sp. G-MC3 TaxID=3046209 RepID=UPI0024B9EBD7|nr:NAD-dependent epimerase/dehydratase family protein [Rhodococcus sp. G-MC3]MDJ0396145.1 NAD-dependent epimerase/dehydratase family protein [Rhodococcus sp. G-MC3]
MRVFLTGATGFIGRGVARAAVDAGHDVTALVRTTTSPVATELVDLGVTIHEGDLADPRSFVALAGSADAVVHAASTNDENAGAVDEAAVTSMLSAMAAGSVLVYTSGAWVYGDTGQTPVSESAELHPTPLVAWRPAVEQHVLALAAERSIAAVVVRPAMVHGHGGGVFAMMAGTGRAGGVIRIAGDGNNRWPTVHVDDLAVAYVSALESAAAGNPEVCGRILNIVSEEAVEVAKMAEAIRGAIGAQSVTPWPVDDARTELGFFADALALDQSIDGTSAQRVLEWAPQQADAVSDLSAWPAP